MLRDKALDLLQLVALFLQPLPPPTHQTFAVIAHEVGCHAHGRVLHLRDPGKIDGPAHRATLSAVDRLTMLVTASLEAASLLGWEVIGYISLSSGFRLSPRLPQLFPSMDRGGADPRQPSNGPAGSLQHALHLPGRPRPTPRRRNAPPVQPC